MNEVRDGKNILANDLQGSNRPPTTEEENDICVSVMQMNTSELICQVVSEAEIFLSASDVKDNYMVCHCNVQASQIHQKLVGVGCLFLNATSGTYYLDNETLASETFLAGLDKQWMELHVYVSYICSDGDKLAVTSGEVPVNTAAAQSTLSGS
ncbi:hypothetical protein HID58_092760 [Brassica napus]|uniref:Uncharacterized protein n=1 Tax=Brassica napus TaxID=3708 RepID=A0ABQ7XDC3_BRANA|nr:hypothetical protein HID58_092760 [Brassica napus]